MQLVALFRLAFATATPIGLTYAALSNSLTHYAKGTRLQNTSILLPLLVNKRFQVLFHSPNRGTFHLSLTVLVRYRLPSCI